MKRILSNILLVLFVSCSKENIHLPSKNHFTQSQLPSATPVSYTSDNIGITNFTAKVTDGTISVSFTTTFQKDVKTLEILRGETTTNLCSIYQQSIDGDSFSKFTYLTSDIRPVTSAVVYYMVKYTLSDSDWGYTPIFELQL